MQRWVILGEHLVAAIACVSFLRLVRLPRLRAVDSLCSVLGQLGLKHFSVVQVNRRGSILVDTHWISSNGKSLRIMNVRQWRRWIGKHNLHVWVLKLLTKGYAPCIVFGSQTVLSQMPQRNDVLMVDAPVHIHLILCVLVGEHLTRWHCCWLLGFDA